ncbi:MFS transporter [Embleya scabrispora]|uniref:MFS transporter n=1 Tax=Embleya scabrispora TaxID=159449 RepID=UPI00039D211E|nr:MFS transporter [Embleya scabrispora]MYS84207.1 MFS transporter [Streptomyces sp. SID5474]
MSATTSPSGPSAASDPDPAPSSPPGPLPALLRGLWHRRLDRYPANGARIFYLSIVVIGSVILYYELYIQYAVSTLLMHEYGMTFMYATMISVVGNAVGAFASLLAGLADRWGRANLVVYGLASTGVLVLFALPNAQSKGWFMFFMALVNIVEGMALVATPALIRDFSPQVGRAGAMGFWTLGPIIGSLVVTSVSSNTLDTSGWQDEFRYAGIAGLVVFVIALFGLRELSPALRDQLMVSLRDKALIEARARGLDVEAAQKNHWRQMMRLDILAPALGISLHLMFYYTVVGNLVVYYSTVYGYSEQRTNALANWYWGANAIALVVVGIASDLTRVRKPFMIVGGVGTVVFTFLFALTTDKPDTGYYTFAWLLVGIGVCSGLTYAPWMAGYTETVEKHNPAATATGLAVWGWIIRIVVSVSAVFTPVIVTSATPLVNHGEEVVAAQADAGPALELVQKDPELFIQLSKFPNRASIPIELQIKALQLAGGDLAKLDLVEQKQKSLGILIDHGEEVQKAKDRASDEWMRWWWLTLACQALFIPCVFVMAGRWSPRKAREDEQAHARRVEEELAALGVDGSPGLAKTG